MVALSSKERELHGVKSFLAGSLQIMKHTHYFYGYLFFLGGILSSMLVMYGVYGSSYFEFIGVLGNIIIAIIFGVLLYGLNLVYLWLGHLTSPRVGLTGTRSHFFSWAFFAGLAPELIYEMLFSMTHSMSLWTWTHTQLIIQGLSVPAVVTMVYVLIKKWISVKHATTLAS